MMIDGVFSGGGLKNFALLGAFQVLEEQGFRFERVAGTSAGAILASFIAAGYTAKEMEDLLDDQNFQTLLDPRKTAVPLPVMKWLMLYWRLGLYQGVALENWFLEKLAAKGLYTFGDLPEGALKLVVSDITNGRMMVIPDDLPRYGLSPETFPVSRALRMSCGLPFFFEPVKLKDGSGESFVVDGGFLSNFPIWLFEDDYGKRERPLIGLKLTRGKKEENGHKIKNGIELFQALFSTMQDAHDERHISKRNEKDIIFIPVDDAKTTQFNMTPELKGALIKRGREYTEKFLKTWSI